MSMRLALIITSLALTLPACKKKQSEVKEAPKPQTNIPKKQDRRLIFDEDIDAFVLEESSDPFSAPASDEAVSFSLVDDTLNEPVDTDIFGFQTIYFDFDSADLRKDQNPRLTQNVEKARKAVSAGYIIVIKGHSCTIAKSQAHNIHLSEERARAVKAHLIAQGINANSIKTVGYGCEQPIIAHGDIDQQAPNRRTEMLVLKTDEAA